MFGVQEFFLNFFGSKDFLGGPPGASKDFSKNPALGVFNIFCLFGGVTDLQYMRDKSIVQL